MYDKLLSLMIWVPILLGVLTLVMNKLGRFNRYMKPFALASACLSFIGAVLLYFTFDPLQGAMQWVEVCPWIAVIHANYHLGVDGISLLLVLLNSLITLIVVWANWRTTFHHAAQYLAGFLIMSGLINGVFLALDTLLFYVFFEAMLIPMYLIIGVWGGPQRVYAALKFFLYTLLGSLLMLVAMIYLYQLAQDSFDLAAWQHLHMPLATQVLLFVAFFLAFAVKVPMWPLHTWLPDAHVEAPTGGSMILAAITLKIGAYGFLRFALPILPDACRLLSPLMIALSLIAVIYIGFVALVQTDMKKLIAYSSISHMGLVTLGLFLFADGHLNTWAVEGALLQMISHGLVSAALFMSIGVLYDRTHSRQIQDYGGVAKPMPIFASLMMLFVMANTALPGTAGFVGELMIIIGAVQTHFWIGCLAGTTVVLSAGYTLWLYKRVIFGDVIHASIAQLKDVNARELWVLICLAMAILGMGLYPQLLANTIHPTIDQLIHHVNQPKF